MKLFNKKIIVGLLILVVIMIGWKMLAAVSKKHHHPPSVTVVTAPVVTQAIPIWLSAPGTVQSQLTVDVVSQINGTIKNIAFTPGQLVKKDQLLFEINPETLSAGLEQAQAILQRDQADLASKQADAKRYAALVKLEYVTKQQYDQAEAAAAAQAAVVAADQAALTQAQIQLSYTKIVAPIAGKTGDTALHIGDLVTAFSATPMVTINQLSPLEVDFNIPQTQLPQLLQYRTATPYTVEIYSDDKKELLGTGTLSFIDNTVNSQTGTVLLKANVQNDQQRLWPGLMVNVRVILATQQNALTVPLSAIQVDDQGAFVYKVVDGKAIVQRVTVNRDNDKVAVISQGLTAQDTVITIIPPDLNDGTPVNTDINKKHKAP